MSDSSEFTIKPLKTKEEVIAVIKQRAAEKGRPPRFGELVEAKLLTEHEIRKNFGTFTEALRASDIEIAGGRKASMESLFFDYATVARKLGRIPTVYDHALHGVHCTRPLRARFKSWKNVPKGLLQFAEENHLEYQWDDVMKMMKEYCQEQARPKRSFRSNTKWKILGDRPLYGELLMAGGMVYAPTNEDGVLLLFGRMAEELGFMITYISREFPDCEVVREAAPGRWQRLLIELEFQSRNFLEHGHDPRGCDLIVCWEHNWPECPLEVIELKFVMRKPAIS